MKFLNDRIQLGFRNEKALVNEKIVSDKEFPVKILTSQDAHVNVIFTYGANKKIFDSYITALADYIINKYEKKLLKRILLKNYGELKPFQVQDILRYMPELANDAETGIQCRRQMVKNGLYTYFSENDSASVEGLVTFRLQKYEKLLAQLAEQLFEIYLAHKEYEEFIELLKYFVNVQGARPRLTHLIVHDGGMYSILNEDKEDITADCISDFARPEEISKDNFDDLLISMLITLAPEKIIVHNSEDIKNAELFETIHKVFGKVVYCQGCEMCKASLKCKM